MQFTTIVSLSIALLASTAQAQIPAPKHLIQCSRRDNLATEVYLVQQTSSQNAAAGFDVQLFPPLSSTPSDTIHFAANEVSFAGSVFNAKSADGRQDVQITVAGGLSKLFVQTATHPRMNGNFPSVSCQRFF
jgi:hypothetical protein